MRNRRLDGRGLEHASNPHSMSSKNPAAVALGKLGGKAGTGAAKSRKTSFTSISAKAALAARWSKAKRKPRASVRRSNDALCGSARKTKNETT